MASRRWKVATAAATLLLAGAVGVLVAFSVGGDDDEPRQTLDESRLRDYLIAPHRTHLSICADGAASLEISEQDVDRVRDALDTGLDSLEVLPAQLAERSVTQGCPAPIALTGEVIGSGYLGGQLSAVVDDAISSSRHRLFVFFVPDSLHDASFRGQPYANAVSESTCRSGTCNELTGALYVPYGATEGELTEALLHHFELDVRSAEPEPTIYWASCLGGTPNSWCKTLDRCKNQRPEDLDCLEIWDAAERQLDAQ